LVFVAGPLEGRVAIVTGGGGGLAEGICARLASDGAAIAAVDVSREKAERVADQVRANGASVVAVEADVSDRRSVGAMAEEVASRLGGVDILVNNAAVYPRRAWTEIEEDEWDRVRPLTSKATSCVRGPSILI
jgi:meso-butanediol dehydrogenase/(S,S)-butanediol dehydrogenase/diacetyl reductase